VLVKQVVNGKVAFFASKAFEAFVVPKRCVEASWVRRDDIYIYFGGVGGFLGFSVLFSF
jgi:hypothetical protein